MSRSYKKSPAGGFTTSQSEKSDKKIWHSRMRAYNRVDCRKACLLDEEELLELNFKQVKEVSDAWGFSKDGKSWHGPYIEGDGFHMWDGEWRTYYDSPFDHYKRILMK